MSLTVRSPEEVAITLEPAGLGRRFIACIIDLLLISAVTSVLTLLALPLPQALTNLLVPTAGFVLFWGYPVWCELRHAGQTIGKRALGLRVVDTRGLPLTLQQSLVRNAARALDMLPLGGIGMISALLDPHGRRVGDLLADTVVVGEQLPAALPPQQLTARRHHALDTLRLRRLVANRVSLAEREFLLALLLRAPRLDETVRYALFERTGDWYRQRLEISDEHLSGENLVRNLVPLCFPSR